MTIHNKIYKVIMQLNTVNSTIEMMYHFIGTDTGTVPFHS